MILPNFFDNFFQIAHTKHPYNSVVGEKNTQQRHSGKDNNKRGAIS
jgi:hypothetical protein